MHEMRTVATDVPVAWCVSERIGHARIVKRIDLMPGRFRLQIAKVISFVLLILLSVIIKTWKMIDSSVLNSLLTLHESDSVVNLERYRLTGFGFCFLCNRVRLSER